MLSGWIAHRPPEQGAFASLFALADISSLGTHEDADPDQVAFLRQRFVTVGWDGPLISVFGLDSDDVAQRCVSDLNAAPFLDVSLGVADGHHRLAALRQLSHEGLLDRTYIPVQVLPVRSSSGLRFRTTPEGATPVTLDELIACARDNERTLSPRGTRFEAQAAQGWVRVREVQPTVRAPLDVLQTG